ncbi:MAG: 30S ribosomal protein S6 [Planctomycetota bacterium]
MVEEFTTLNQYEAMFLFDPTFAGSFENCEGEIRRIMTRAEAEIVFCRKWDERRLTYKIKGRKRGTYVLVYFNAPPGKITSLERDVLLSENVLRVLILRADGVTPDLMEKLAAPRTVEGDLDSGDGEGGGDRRPRREERHGGGGHGGSDDRGRHRPPRATVGGGGETQTESVVTD